MSTIFSNKIVYKDMRTVYGLVHPITNEVFYIGETKDVKKRYAAHLRTSGSGNELKDSIVKEIREVYKLKPICIIFQDGIQTKEESVKIETEYIKLHKHLGYKLVNMNEGGNKPPSQAGRVYDDSFGRKLLEASSRKKTVYQYDKDMNIVSEFISVREAGRITGIDHRSIAEVANGSNPKRHRAGGYYWKYNKEIE